MSDSSDFIAAIFGDGTSGWACIGRLPADQSERKPNFKINVSDWFLWPNQEAELTAFVDAHSGQALYMPPMLFNARRRTKESVLYTPCLWADTDEADPKDFDLHPTITVETSPGRYQGYWLLTDMVRPEWAESMSKKITYSRIEQGSDYGWNLGRYLRLPGSTNGKYAEPFTVTMSLNGAVYTADDIERVYGRLDISALAGVDRPLPSVLPERTLVTAKVPLDYSVQRAMVEPPPQNSWSETLWWLECELFRMHLTAVEVFVLVRGCACDKYERDHRPEGDLWKEVLRAEAAIVRAMLTGLEPSAADEIFEMEAPKLVSEADRQGLPRTFIDDYVEWAATRTNADRGYQEFGAMAVMSTVLGDFGFAVPSFGRLNLNMWFMLMGVTTRTYKTTSKHLMLEILRLCQTETYDYDLGSDATAEGLIVELADRPDRSVIFHRDEVNALFLQSKGGKNYMMGFIEFLTEAYERFIRGRIRSTGNQKRTPSVATSFNMFMLGVPEKIGEVLQADDFASGFLPRFLFVLGRPEPPTDTYNHITQNNPTEQYQFNDPMRDDLHKHILDVRNYWNNYAGAGQQVAILLDEPALNRFNAFITDIDKLGRVSKAPEMFEPSINRMTKAALKLVCLLAMMDKRQVANQTDVLIAVTYVERWYLGLTQAISIVGRNAFAAQVEAFVNWVKSQPAVTYTEARRKFANLTPHNWDELINTAQDQSYVRVEYVGNTKMVTAI